MKDIEIMGVSYQTKNRLRRKVMTAPLSAPPAPLQQAPVAPVAPRFAWWPLVAAAAVAVTAFVFLYRG